MKITAPYNFVPLNEKVFYPSWSEQVTQDLPFSDSEDGVIEVKIKNVSPLFTRDGALNEHSAHIMGKDGKRHYFIPGTTIKGMLREIIEIMSFGKMQEDKDFQNRLFGYRDVANIMGDEIHKQYMKTVEKAKPGWLSKKGEKYFFTPCDGQLEEISRTKVKSEFPGYNPNGSIWETNVSVGSDSNQYPIYPEKEIGDKKYHIVCTGLIEKKTKELLFPSDRGKSSPLNEETIRLFKIVYEETPDFAEEKDGKGCFLMALEKAMKYLYFMSRWLMDKKLLVCQKCSNCHTKTMYVNRLNSYKRPTKTDTTWEKPCLDTQEKTTSREEYRSVMPSWREQ